MRETVYAVDGMTCEHCRAAVVDEVAGLPGVVAAEVDLSAGTLRVRGADVDEAALATAVAEAGYTLR